VAAQYSGVTANGCTPAARRPASWTIRGPMAAITRSSRGTPSGGLVEHVEVGAHVRKRAEWTSGRTRGGGVADAEAEQQSPVVFGLQRRVTRGDLGGSVPPDAQHPNGDLGVASGVQQALGVNEDVSTSHPRDPQRSPSDFVELGCGIPDLPRIPHSQFESSRYRSVQDPSLLSA